MKYNRLAARVCRASDRYDTWASFVERAIRAATKRQKDARKAQRR